MACLVRAVVALAAVAACSKEGGDPPVKPGPPPPHVAAVISLPSYQDLQGRLGAFADYMTPGEGARLARSLAQELAERLHVERLDGFDRHRPMHLVLLAPPDDVSELVLVAAVGERELLQRSTRGAGLRVSKGWAVVGARAAVEATAPWALHELTGRPAPRVPTARVHPAVLRAANPDDYRNSLDSPLTDPYLFGPVAYQFGWFGRAARLAFEQSDRIDLTVEISATALAFEATLTPRTGTALAAFTAAQQPSTFSLFEHLPRPAGGGYAGGRLATAGLDPEQLRRGVTWWLTQLLRREPDAAELARIDAWLGRGGEVALEAGMAIGLAVVTGAEVPADAGEVRALPAVLAHQVDDAQARGDSFLVFAEVGGDPASLPRDGMWAALGAGTAAGTLRVHASASTAQLATLANIAVAERDRPEPEP